MSDFFEKIINKENFVMTDDHGELDFLRNEIYEMEKIIGFEMQFTRDFYNYYTKSRWISRKIEVDEKVRNEIIYFTKLKKEKELIEKQAKEKEDIIKERNEKEYNNFITLQRKRLLWNAFPEYEYNEVIKGFELEEQNITITITIPTM